MRGAAKKIVQPEKGLNSDLPYSTANDKSYSLFDIFPWSGAKELSLASKRGRNVPPWTSPGARVLAQGRPV